MRRRAGIERELVSRTIRRVLRWFRCLKNEPVKFGQKGVDGGSKWRAGMRQTEVRQDGWYESEIGQIRNDCGGCATNIRKSGEPGCICKRLSFTLPFWL